MRIYINGALAGELTVRREEFWQLLDEIAFAFESAKSSMEIPNNIKTGEKYKNELKQLLEEYFDTKGENNEKENQSKIKNFK
jgi:hypothetical protein